MNETRGFSCPFCGSNDLCFGYIGSNIGGSGNAFVPSGMFTLHGFRTRSFVCLACGQVGQFIPRDKLEKLRAKFHEHDES
jgi:hypothetical protein